MFGLDKLIFSQKEEKKITIFVDLDGVVANLNSHVVGLLKLKDNKEVISKLEETGWIGSAIGDDGFWEAVNKTDYNFWESIPKYDYADKLINELKKHGEVVFLTSPGNIDRNAPTASDAAKGKTLWIKRHFPDHKYIITRSKYFCANKNHILVDDLPKNIEEFEEHGGNGFLWGNIFKINSDKEIEKLIKKIKSI